MCFWRGKILEKEATWYEDPAAQALIEQEDAAAQARQTSAPAEPKLFYFDDKGVEVQYDPSRGATLNTDEGAIFQFPAGSVRSSETISAKPLAWLPAKQLNEHLMLAGPAYKLMIGKESHYEFARPIRVTLKYFLESERAKTPPKDLVLCTFHNGNWESFPGTVDPVKKTISGNIPHCSIVAVGGGILVLLGGDYLATGNTFTNTYIQNTINFTSNFLDDVYRTKHFTIHYSRKPGRCIPLSDGNPPFPLKPQFVDTGQPNFIAYAADQLEFCYEHLGLVGMHQKSAGIINQHVYFVPQDDLGQTPAGGGSILFTCDWNKGQPYRANLAQMIKATIAHELIHVAQGRYYLMGGQAKYNGWWIEMSAAFLADVFWELQSEPTEIIPKYYMPDDSGKLLAKPLDSPFDSNDGTFFYRYGCFLNWLRTRSDGDILKVLHAMKVGGTATLGAFDSEIQKEFKHPLGELLAEFSQHYYHFDVPYGKILPPSTYGNSQRTRASSQSSAKDEFVYLGRVPAASSGGASIGKLQLFAEHAIRTCPHLTTQAFPIFADALPSDRKAKLVIQFERSGPANDKLKLRAATANFSAPGSAEPFADISMVEPRATLLLKEFGGGKNRATVLLSNTSATEELTGGILRRWLLLAPAWAQSSRKPSAAGGASTEWRISWHRAELRDFPEAFKCYLLYRRKKGDPDSAFQLVKEIEVKEGESTTDQAPDLEDYVYAVRVKDSADHESENSPVDGADPFQGTWEGEVKLVEGSLVEPLIAAVKKAADEEDKKELASIAKEKDSQTRERRIKSWNKSKAAAKAFWDETEKLLRLCEQAARLGIPVQFKIRSTDGYYFFRLTEVLWQDTGQKAEDDFELKRDGRFTLRFPKIPPEIKPLFLRLHREEEIRTQSGEYVIEIQDEKKQKTKCVLNWSFKRKSPENEPVSPPKPAPSKSGGGPTLGP